jgi:hypothetical protein
MKLAAGDSHYSKVTSPSLHLFQPFHRWDRIHSNNQSNLLEFPLVDRTRSVFSRLSWPLWDGRVEEPFKPTEFLEDD